MHIVLCVIIIRKRWGIVSENLSMLFQLSFFFIKNGIIYIAFTYSTQSTSQFAEVCIDNKVSFVWQFELKETFRALESTECRTTETDSYCLPATWIRYFSLALSKRSKSSNWSLLLHRIGIKHGCTLSAWLLSTKEQRSNWCKFKTKADTWLYWFRKDFWRMCEVVTQ